MKTIYGHIGEITEGLKILSKYDNTAECKFETEIRVILKKNCKPISEQDMNNLTGIGWINDEETEYDWYHY